MSVIIHLENIGDEKNIWNSAYKSKMPKYLELEISKRTLPNHQRRLFDDNEAVWRVLPLNQVTKIGMFLDRKYAHTMNAEYMFDPGESGVTKISKHLPPPLPHPLIIAENAKWGPSGLGLLIPDWDSGNCRASLRPNISFPDF